MKQEDDYSLQLFTKAVKTDDVVKTLYAIAKEWECHIAELDFDILDVRTFYGENQIVFNLNSLDYMTDMVGGSKKPQDVTQEYKILVHKRDEFSPALNLSLASNKNLTKIYAAIKQHTVLNSENITRDSFRDIANKKMLMNHLLIGSWSVSLEEAIERIFEKIDNRNTLQLKNDLKFLISEGQDPISCTPPNLTMHFEKEAVDFNSLEQVNHSNRDFIKTTTSGALIAEYIYFKPGSYGRNCKGQTLSKDIEPSKELAPPKYDPETIMARDEDGSLKLYARQDGIIDIKDNIIAIKTSLDLKKACFKSTGDLQGKHTANATLNVGTNSSWQDAVGQGVTIEAKEINVSGNVGPNATLRGDTIKVCGRTHETCTIFGNDLQINIHSGKSTAKTTKVNLLERGKLQGESMEIREMFAGTVLADNVIVHKMHNLCNITASKSVLIHEIIGKDNRITINNENFTRNIKRKEHENIKVEQAHNRLLKELKHKEHLKKIQTPQIEETLLVLKDYKKRGLKMPFTLMNRIKEYRLLDGDILLLTKQIKEYADTLELLQENLTSTEDMILNSQVIIGHVIDEQTTIEFQIDAGHKTLRTFAKPFTSYSIGKSIDGTFKIETNSYANLGVV